MTNAGSGPEPSGRITPKIGASGMSGLIDKNAVGVGVRQFHVGVAPGEVGTVALLPGDPFRVPLIAEFLEGAREVAHNREHRTMVGTYKASSSDTTSWPSAPP